MSRFILRFRGTGPKPPEDVERIRTVPDIIVLDDSSPHMLLVEAREEELKNLLKSMPRWVVTLERMISLPDPRPKPQRE